MSKDKLKQAQPAADAEGHVQPVVMQPCPFCGGNAVITTVHHPKTMQVIGYNGMCVDCSSLGAEGETKEEANQNWNSRVV